MAKEKAAEKAEEKPLDFHWRNTMKVARFFNFDARASFFLLLVLMHMRMWTFGLAVSALIFFYLLERKGLTFPASLRAIRLYIIGNKRPAVSFALRRRLLDTGS